MNTAVRSTIICLAASFLILQTTSCSLWPKPAPTPVVSWVSVTLTKGARPDEIIYSLKNLTGDHLVIADHLSFSKWEDKDLLVNPDLKVLDSHGQPIAYRGVLACGVSPFVTPLLTLSPHQAVTTHISVSHNYEVKAGSRVSVDRHDQPLRLMRFHGIAERNQWMSRIPACSYDHFKYVTTVPTTPVSLRIQRSHAHP